MPMPNFLLIGFPKAGTTSVYHYLKQHPEVFVSPIKEPNFFVYKGQNRNILPCLHKDVPVVKSPEEYRGLFQNASEHRAIGEASVLYSVDPRAAEQIRHHIPNIKLIVLLRDPVDRAYSAYWMRRQDGGETRSFEQAILEELSGQYSDSVGFEARHYIHWGFYNRHLRVYLDSFDRPQIGVYLFDDLRADPASLMREIFRFLEVDEDFAPDTSIRHNVSGAPKYKMLTPIFAKSAFTRSLRRALPGPLERRARAIQEYVHRQIVAKPPMPPALRKRLVCHYHGDILRLKSTIERDLSGWLR